LASLTDHRTWLRAFTYALFIFSAFTIAGVSAATMLLYVAVAYHLWRERPRIDLPRWLVAGMLALPAAAILSALVNPDPLENIAQLRREYQIFLPLALIPALEQTRARRLLVALLIPVAIVAAYAVIQYFWGVDWFRPEGKKMIRPYGGSAFYGKGTFSHHLTFSGYMLLNTLLFGGLAFKLRERERWLWAAGAAAAAIGVTVALGRSGWAGTAVGLFMLAGGFPRRIWLPVTLAVAFFALSGTLVVSGYLREAIPPEARTPLVKRMLNTSLSKDRERLYLWESAVLGIRDYPVFGVGYGNSKIKMAPYRETVSETHGYRFSVAPSMHSHNVYLQVTFELGAVGLAAYLFMWMAVLRWNTIWARRAGGELPFEAALLTGISCALAASMVAGLFENNFFDAEVRTMILILMGLSIHTGLVVRRELAARGGAAA
jgi:O-antigen ligase